MIMFIHTIIIIIKKTDCKSNESDLVNSEYGTIKYKILLRLITLIDQKLHSNFYQYQFDTTDNIYNDDSYVD